MDKSQPTAAPQPDAAAARNIESFYPLSPMQQGMLFHSLFAPESGVYVEQLNTTLRGRLDIPAFERTWQRVVQRHPILRTAFAWEGLKEPIQVVRREVAMTIAQEDWRGLDPAEQQHRLAVFLQTEQARGFDLTRAPLIRLALLRLADDAYEFVWTHHHILLDGWSIPLLLHEVFAHYDAFSRGQDLQLPAPRPFRDYIVWLRRQDMAQAEAYWRRTLKGFTAPTPLTVGMSAPDAGEAVAHGELEVHLPVDLTEKLIALARQHRLTLNTLVMGAWALLLSRYSREEDVLFGATVSGRPADLPGAESMMGLFINTLPVRVHVPPAADLLTWLRELQAQQAELRQYEYTPLVEIQGWSEMPRSLPLFESILVFENLPLGKVTAGGASGGALEVADVRSASHTNYPITVVAVPDREMLLRLSYDNARFDPATMERMMGHLRTLLAGFVEDPNRQLRQFPLLTAAERQALITRWDATARQFPAEATIHSLFEAQAAATPDAVALNLPPVEAYTSALAAPPLAPAGVALTYSELNARANQLAHHLRGLGVGPNVLVAMYVDRSIAMVVGILGILKAGGAYVPIDPVYPAERIQHILADSGAQIVLTHAQSLEAGNWKPEAGSEQLEAGDGSGPGRLVRLDADWPIIAQQPTSDIPDSQFLISNSLAYVIYTSGSTGVPKGCGITHANVVRLFRATEHWYEFDATDVWTLFHSYAFDFTVWELWGALFYGGRLVVIPHAITRSPDAFYRLLCAERVTVLNQTPSAFRQLIRAEEAVGVCPELALRYVIFGGEALELQSLRPWYARHGDTRPKLVNMYGITETTVHVTYRPLSLADVEAGKGSVIGVPIPDLQVYIVDANLEPVPIGVPGELVVGGAGVAPGYLNRPELTAERFVRNPFEPVAGSRLKVEADALACEQPANLEPAHLQLLYRSGDLARYLPDGDIEYLGRIDHQVKIRGFRVELGEIETLLAQHPGIREAIVLAREDTPGHKRLVAYCVPDRAATPALSELRDFLAAKLPDYMVPAAFVMLDALPLTVHGKVDRKALPAPDEGRLAVETAYVAPRNETEAQLAAIWAQVLGVPRVGIRDNYFELGGESILSLQIIARAKKAGIEFSPRQLFEHPTIGALLAALQGARDIVAEQGVVTGPAPLTPVQQWFFEHHPAHPEHFNTSMLLLTWPEVDLAALRGAVAALLTHHDALRMTFVHTDAGWQQTNAGRPVDVPFDSVDLSGLEPEAQEAALAAKTGELQAGFRLDGAGLLVRAAHFNLGAGRPGRLLLAFHHLVADGVSWRIVLEDLVAAYRMLRRGGTQSSLTLPPKTTAYRDWAARLAEYAGSPAALAEAPYWHALAAQPVAALPVDHPGGRNTYGATEDVTLSLSAAETQALLQEAPAAYGTQINDLLLTALARTLAAWTGSPRLLVEMEGHGREDLFPEVDVSRTVGWFTSIFPVLLDLDGSVDGSPGPARPAILGDQIQRVRDQLRSVPNRGFGYGILRYLAPDPALRAALTAAPAPQVNFNYLGQFNSLISEADDAAEPAVEPSDPEAWAFLGIAPEAPGPEQAPDAPRSALLYVVCVVTDGGMDVRWLYSPELFERSTIERLAETYLREVRSIIAHCQAQLSGGIRG